MNIQAADNRDVAEFCAGITDSSNAAMVSSREVIEISDRVPVNMHDEYFEYATANHFWIQWRFAELQRLIAGLDLGQQVLEVGSGNGVMQAMFEEVLNVPVHGCDLNLEALQKTGPVRGNVYLYNVMDRCPEWQGWFDTVLLLDVLEHIPSSIEFLAALWYHLRAGGHLVINVPALHWLYSRYDSAQGHVVRYTLKQLRTELSLAGFELVDFRYWGSNLIPVAALRKLLVQFMSDKKAMKCGFQPNSKWTERTLRLLMWLERHRICVPGYGTSLAVVARRRNMG